MTIFTGFPGFSGSEDGSSAGSGFDETTRSRRSRSISLNMELEAPFGDDEKIEKKKKILVPGPVF